MSIMVTWGNSIRRALLLLLIYAAGPIPLKTLAENILSFEELDLTIEIPKLPNDWRLATKKELAHTMRPMNSFPDYLLFDYFDFDFIADWAILAVKKDRSKQGLLIYLSSQTKWITVAETPFTRRQVTMTIGTQGNKPTKISYGKLGGHGYIYSWNDANQSFDATKD